MSRPPAPVKGRYDWKACVIAIVVGLGVATPAGLAVAAGSKSTLLLTAVVTVVGTSVSRWVYTRLARPGSRPISEDGL
jgi:hypothetical protein